MKVCNLTSGSDGNCTYIETDKIKILLDVGLSASNIYNRLKSICVDANDIDIILITHEHGDHIKGLDVFARKYNCKILVHKEGIEAVYLRCEKLKIENFLQFDDRPFVLRGLKITSFKLDHDSVYNCGFIFEENGKKFAYLTDVGQMNANALDLAFGSDLVFIESNYDEQMLMNNEFYPLSLKKRIKSSCGHLSNDDCAKVVFELYSSGVQKFCLAHLSTKNNTKELAYQTTAHFMQERNCFVGKHYFQYVLDTNIGEIFEI